MHGKKPFLATLVAVVLALQSVVTPFSPHRVALAAPPPASGEDESLRTANTKVFHTPTGLEYHIYPKPVHVRDSSGKWQNIRPTVQKSTLGGKYAFQTTTVPYEASFTDNADQNEVAFRYQNAVLHFRPLALAGASKFGARMEDHAVTYSSAGGEADLHYETGQRGLKESIILRKPTTTNVFTFGLDWENAQPQVLPDGRIDVVGADGRPLWSLAAPTAVDAAGIAAPKVTQVIQNQGGQSILVVTVDQAWLSDPARKWPVVVDPTLVIAPDPADGMEINVPPPGGTSGSPNSPTLGASSAGAALLKFNLSAIPAGSQVTSANLWLMLTSGNGPGTLQVQPVGTDWNEWTVTSTYPWPQGVNTALGGVVDSIVFPGCSTCTTTLGSGWLNFTVTGLVNQWISGARGNFGLALTMTADALQVASSAATDPNTVPQLIVTVATDVTPPTASINTPADGSTVSGPVNVNLSVADAAPGTIDRVELYMDQALIGVSKGPVANGTVSMNDVAGLATGTHTLEAHVYDRAGHTAVARSAFTTTGVAVPAGIGALGMGNGKVQVAWQAAGGSGFTYNIYRSTTPNFAVASTNQIATGVTATVYTDVPPAGSSPYYYRVTAVSSGVESAPTRSVAATAASSPTVTLAFTGSGVDQSAFQPTVKQTMVMPNLWLPPTHPAWQQVTAANSALVAADGVQFTTTTSAPAVGMQAAQLISFDLLGTVNNQRRAAGLPDLSVVDLRALLSGITPTWTSTQATKYLWNDVQHQYDTNWNVMGTSANYVDGTGKIHALVTSSTTTADSTQASVSSDTGYLTVSYPVATPGWITAAPIGNGEVQLAWAPSPMVYNVYRGTSSSFTPSASNQVGHAVGTASFVDSASNGLQPGTTYYYKVAGITADGLTGFITSQAVGVNSNPSAWAVPTAVGPVVPNRLCAGNVNALSASDLAALTQVDGVAAAAQYCTLALGIDLSSLIKQQYGISLSWADIQSQVDSVILDWTGYSSSPYNITFSALAPGSSLSAPQWSTLATLSPQSTQRLLLNVPISSFTGTLGIQAYSNGSNIVYTDAVRVGVIFRPTTKNLTTVTTPDGYVSLSWSGTGLYHVYRTTNSGTGYLRLTSSPVATSFMDRLVEPGRNYSYVVRPVSAAGVEGTATSPVSVTTPPTHVGYSKANYTGTYWYDSGSMEYSSASYTDSTYSINYTFTGSGVVYHAQAGNWGQYSMAIDGAPASPVNLCNNAVFDQPDAHLNIGQGTHTVQISYAGSGSPYPGFNWGPACTGMNVTGFDVYSSLPAPTGVTAVASPGPDKVTVQWQPFSNAVGYNVYRTTTSGNWYQRVNASPVTGTAYTDISTPSGPVYYVVTAIMNNGPETPASTEAPAYAGVGRYDDPDPFLSYSGTWSVVPNPAAWGASYHSTSASGAKVNLTFNSGGVRVLGTGSGVRNCPGLLEWQLGWNR